MILTKRRIKRILESKILNRMGISIYTVGLVRYLKHHLWLLKIGRIPSTTIVYRKVREVTQNDLNLCERLLEAYRRSIRDASKADTGPLWSSVIDRHYEKLVSSLESEKPDVLALILSSLFREDFVFGLASGDLINKFCASKLGSKLWALKYYDNVIALAEYLGVVRTESPEQGMIGYSLKGNLNDIVAKIEGAIGMSIGFPDVGGPYGVLANNSLITMEHPEHVYVVSRIHQAVCNHFPVAQGRKFEIVEIGGGFGGLAYWMVKYKGISVASYTIVDLPIVNVLQGYFLSKALGEENVRFYGESNSKKTLISVSPTFAISSMHEKDVDILINQNSMPEMTQKSVGIYIQFAKTNLKGIFFSYNHEAYAPVSGTPQVLVPDIVSLIGGLKRVSRNISWLRNGYVEETYISETASS
jgi:hypothetical protein